MSRFVMLSCPSAPCELRFPADATDLPSACPMCGARPLTAEPIPQRQTPGYAHEPAETGTLRLLLDNIRSLRNVGTILRTADGAGVAHVYLCGITGTPEHPKLAKTALGAERVVSWSHARNALHLARRLLADGYRLWALEGVASAENVLTLPPDATNGAPIVLVAGSERAGVDPALLALCEKKLYIPMRGIKQSLNVATATGIAVYHLLENRF